jgi:outer membrane biosynthesis protein TonB
MRFDRGMMLSVAAHGLFLVWALVTFARPFEANPAGDSIPVDFISVDDFTKLTAGAEKAPKTEKPAPVVEKIAEAKPVEDLTAKVTEKKEVKASTEETNLEPTPKKSEPKPAAAPPEPKQEAKAADKPEPDQKVDPIAEALKKDDAKKPEKKVENKPQPVKKPEPQQPKYDPRQALANVDRRIAQRTAAAGTTMNSIASQGAPKGEAAKLSANELDALRYRLGQNWNVPVGTPPTMKIRIRISLRPDGTLAAPPEVTTDGYGEKYQAVRDSALRAITVSAPFNMLRPATYETWRELDLGFTPQDFM